MINVFVFILGLLIGSFLNVCIYRIPRGESISFPPSHCTKCGERIKPYDLIPLLSYAFLRGKCRYCKDKISFRYPLIELITGSLFLGIFLRYGMEFITIKYMVLTALLLVIGLIDFDTTDIYNSISVFGMISAVVFIVIEFVLLKIGYISYFNLYSYLLGAGVCGGIIYLIAYFTGGMGYGDGDICIICGGFLGFKLGVMTLFISFIIGGAIGIILILLKKKSRKDYIPFGPYIAIAAILVMIFGNFIYNWYFSLFK